MKSKTKVSILFALGIIFLFFSILNSRFSNNFIANGNYLEFNENDQVQIKQSGFWNLTGSPVFIDDSATGVEAHNWTWAETQPWCSGSGSWADPYVIENVTIDGQGSGNCMEIKSSNAYFIIRNCTLYNSGPSWDNAGIKLNTVDNGKLINNNCSNNNYNGIHLRRSNNNTLSGNTASNNSYYGIYLSSSNNNTLSGNIASNNYHGMYFTYSNNNILTGNTAINNSFYGIYINHSDNNTLSENLMYLCGISLFGSLAEMSSQNIENTNLVNNKPVYYYVNEIGLGSGDFTNAGQIMLISCNNSIISGLNISDGSGILLRNSHNNALSGNIVNKNYRGIFLWYSDNNMVSGNNAKNNIFGIYLRNSNNNTLSGNTAKNNTFGIYLLYSNNNTLSGNTVNNSDYGILLSSSNNNKFVLNHFTNNEIDAFDDGINNKWDNGTIGNYWDDYDGIDANDDGIGDTPYSIPGSAGSQDNFPIWDDGDEEIPEVLIISFGNYYVLFTTIAILSFIILEKQKKK